MSRTDAPTRRTRRRRRTCRSRVRTAWGLATLTACTTLGGGTGCTAWNAGPPPRGGVPYAVTYDHPVRLRFANGNTAVLTHARVVGDSIVGDVDNDAFNTAGTPPLRFAAALGAVRGLEEQHASRGRTVALVLVPLLAVAIILAVEIASTPLTFTPR